MRRIAARWALPWVMLSAALFALSFPSAASMDGFGVLAWFALVPLFLVLMSVPPRWGVFYGTVFGTLQALFINYWQGSYGYVTLYLVIIACLIEYLLLMLPLVWLIRWGGRWSVVTVPLAWTFFDWCRSSGVLGYPWGLIGASQYRLTPLIQIASITGVWGIGFVVLLCNASIAWSIDTAGRGFQGEGRQGLPSRTWRSVLPILGFLTVLAFCLVAGLLILQRTKGLLAPESGAPRVSMVLVQQNTDPRKHSYSESYGSSVRLTAEALEAAPMKPDLIVWSEGALQLDLRYWLRPDKANTIWAEEAMEFLQYVKGLNTWLLTGSEDYRISGIEDGKEILDDYNSSTLVDPKGQIRDTYHKMHLVPFTERFPLDKQKYAGLYALFQKFDISDWEPGEERLVFRQDRMSFITPICFEDVFPDDVRRFITRGVDAIVVISNDYWSLDPVEGRQHAIFSFFRAVENRRPLVRSTSSGSTISVDAAGRILPGSLQPYTASYLLTEVTFPGRDLTFYTRYGDWFPVACGVAVLCIVPLPFIRRKSVPAET